MRAESSPGLAWVRVVSEDAMNERSERGFLANVGACMLLGALSIAACSKETPAPEGPAGSMAPAAGEDEASEPGAAAQQSFDESSFGLKISPKGSYKAGTAGSVEIVLDAKKPFHVNDKYPYKFKLAKSEGVKYAGDVVKKDAVKLETQRAVMTVGFTPESAGKKKIAGQFAFSVCTDDKCLIEKRDLALEVSVE
jgi:hypothetical protein